MPLCETTAKLAGGSRRTGGNLASYMKPGDKGVDTLASSRMIGDVVLCTGGYTFTPASGASAEKGFWTKVVGKAGGEWKILNLTFAIAAPQ